MPGIDYSAEYSQINTLVNREIAYANFIKIENEHSLRNAEHRYRIENVNELSVAERNRRIEHINSLNISVNLCNRKMKQLKSFRKGVFDTHVIPISRAREIFDSIVNVNRIPNRI